MDIIRDKLKIASDGSLSVGEIIAAVIALLVMVLLAWTIFRFFRAVIEYVNPRKSTIFSHRKNKYKNRIGKKNKF